MTVGGTWWTDGLQRQEEETNVRESLRISAGEFQSTMVGYEMGVRAEE